jgi:hypothetical protein
LRGRKRLGFFKELGEDLLELVPLLVFVAVPCVAIAIAYFYLAKGLEIVSRGSEVPLAASIAIVVATVTLLTLAHKKINGAIHLCQKVIAILALYLVLWPFSPSVICTVYVECDLRHITLIVMAVAIIDLVLTIIEGRNYGPKIVPNKSIKPFSISGPPMFTLAVDQLMQELEFKDPETHQMMVKHMPQIVYYDKLKVSADSRGVFSLGGENYEELRYMVLHELGHASGKDEKGADRFADSVLERIGAAPFKRTFQLSCKVIS